MLTIKSDDVTGRAKAYEAIIKNEDILQPGVPESFKVLVKELQSLGLAIEVINEEEKITLAPETAKVPQLEAETDVPKDTIQAEVEVAKDIVGEEVEVAKDIAEGEKEENA